MTLPMKLLFMFVSMWVLGDVAGSSYSQKMYWAVMMTIGTAYLENVHWLIWKYLKDSYRKLFKIDKNNN